MERERYRWILPVRWLPLGVVALAAGCHDETTDPAEPSRPTAITVGPVATELNALGATVQLSADVLDQNGQVMTGAIVAWTSTNTAVANVNASGLVIATGNGTSTITASAGAASGSAGVTVAQAVGVAGVSPPFGWVAPGDTVRLQAEALDANGHLVEGIEFTWSSGNVTVATVDDSGLVRGVSAGTTTITATSTSATATARVIVPGPEWAALAVFYEATNGPGWVNNDGWLSDRPVAQWHGVTTGEGGHVTRLELPASDLAGSLPPDLSRLTHLEVLNLERNSLAGPIAPELGELRNLRALVLGVNDLTGQIPSELGGLANLEDLRLRRNELMGQVPPGLANTTLNDYITTCYTALWRTRITFDMQK